MSPGIMNMLGGLTSPWLKLRAHEHVVVGVWGCGCGLGMRGEVCGRGLMWGEGERWEERR